MESETLERVKYEKSGSDFMMRFSKVKSDIETRQQNILKQKYSGKVRRQAINAVQSAKTRMKKEMKAKLVEDNCEFNQIGIDKYITFFMGFLESNGNTKALEKLNDTLEKF